MLLALDTSTALTGLACYDAGGLLGECSWYSGRNHTAQVLPQLQVLLQHIGRSRTDLQAVGVALGPGSWSGLRVGMSLAKGLALAGGLALIGIGTLDALAYQQQAAGSAAAACPIYPLIRLGRGRFATAAFAAMASGGAAAQAGYQSLTLDELAAQLQDAPGPLLFCGDIDAGVQEALGTALGERARFPTPAANLRRPGFLAERAWQRFAAGERASLAGLEPIYLGAPVQPKPPHPASGAP